MKLSNPYPMFTPRALWNAKHIPLGWNSVAIPLGLYAPCALHMFPAMNDDEVNYTIETVNDAIEKIIK